MTFAKTPNERRVLGGTVAVLALLALDALLLVTRGSLDGWMTPLGHVAPLDLLAVALAMLAGGAVARQGFRGWAVALVVLVGLTGAIAAYGQAPPSLQDVPRWLLRNTGLQLLLSAPLAWWAAHAGQRLAARRARIA